METKKAKNTSVQTPQVNASFDNSAMVIPVIHEEATIDKQVIETGKVLISKRISQHEEMIDVPLLREEVTVERVPVNQYVDAPQQVRYEGDTMIIPIVQEQVVYQKRLVLVEELRVKKQIFEDHKPQQVTLQREEVEVKRSAGNKNSGG